MVAVAGAGERIQQRLAEISRKLRGIDNVRAHKMTVGRDAADIARQLNGRHRHRALPDAHRDGLAGKPFFVEGMQLPLRAGHQPGGLVGQIDPGRLSQSHLVRVFGNGVDTQPVGQRVEVGVARPRNGVLDVHHAVMLVAGIEVPVEGRAPVAHHLHGLRHALLQTGQRHENLERRARRKLRLDGAVHHGVQRIGHQLIPIIAADFHRKTRWDRSWDAKPAPKYRRCAGPSPPPRLRDRPAPLPRPAECRCRW